MDKQALKDWRKGHGMTQVRAAKLLEVSLATYKRWEKGDPQQYPKLLELACQAAREKLEREGGNDRNSTALRHLNASQ